MAVVHGEHDWSATCVSAGICDFDRYMGKMISRGYVLGCEGLPPIGLRLWHHARFGSATWIGDHLMEIMTALSQQMIHQCNCRRHTHL